MLPAEAIESSDSDRKPTADGLFGADGSFSTTGVVNYTERGRKSGSVNSGGEDGREVKTSERRETRGRVKDVKERVQEGGT